MTSKTFSVHTFGLNCVLVEVQADISNGLPAFNIVGLADTSVQESRQRVRTSIKNSDLTFPQTRKTINLAPAELRKKGTHFDLPIAISLLLASKQVHPDLLKDSLIIGELGLSGWVNRVNSVLLITKFAQRKGFKKIYLPAENATEASYIKGIKIYPVETLKQLVNHLNGYKEIQTAKNINPISPEEQQQNKQLFSNIVGQERAKQALIISAAGGHNIILTGSPGCGKTVLCRAYKELQTSLSLKEIFETTAIYSSIGKTSQQKPLIQRKPFREVHHTATTTALIGGSNPPKPGEITLAHNGALFLDEIAEFSKQTLEALRQPIEDGYININKASYAIRYPSSFTLLATMNPCPCGYYKDEKIKCICSSSQRKSYQKRISGPLLDRFDLILRVPRQKILGQTNDKLSTSKIYDQIQNAKSRQHSRGISNSKLTLKKIQQCCSITEKANMLLKAASEKHNLSSRATLKIIKVAQTLSDLKNSTKITQKHISIALQFRSC